uniref:ATP-dependent Clp protease proteolytic subunit n=5 Tax=Mesangiospermae TaxID=1437183 RepID=A0A7H0R1D4_9ROSI|nr:ATP-dependent Clp protease proteolytic subunit [Viola ulleungdoensis]YP_009996166.1 clp protease proteolytic subunit [Viola philippica]YP_010239483.1 clp protease proteolytic subunit [Corydalis bungeana]YP_010312573.1 ATP-dependent Clp protease proteolytic subunit 1 [Viola arcuata]YP_010318427.1 ATP-dependent Clp protease proteolytic subunit [Viola grypoceras]YP_010424980.1 clp protease proteolytic subunit [Viola acuminata]YP_010425062.1 clp protease proteolytic subunit [Viola chaerophyllo
MPIGVPKVRFQLPGRGHKNWIDIYNRLYRERLLFLGQMVDSAISNQLIALMLYLSAESETKDLYLFINSPGGWVIPGMAIYDTMQYVRPDIQTVCMGLAASMGSIILVGGKITKRIAFPHARVMIHQPSAAYSEGQVAEFVLEAEELLKLREILTKVYAQRTGKPLWIVSEDMERDTFMSATEAQAHGIVDLVAVA